MMRFGLGFGFRSWFGFGFWVRKYYVIYRFLWFRHEYKVKVKSIEVLDD